MARPIFLAAPEAGDGALGVIDKILVQLEIVSRGQFKGSQLFSPHLQVGDVGVDASSEDYFTRSLVALQESTVVIAVLDGPQVDENVAFLLGYAFASQKPVIGYVTDGRPKGPYTLGVTATLVHDVKGLVKELRGRGL